MIDVNLSTSTQSTTSVGGKRSILFPMIVTMLMAALNSSWSVTAGSVSVMQTYYQIKSEWWVNSVNFSYYWIYWMIGFPPILQRVTSGTSRGHLLLTACVFSLGGLIMQMMWSYKGGFLYLWMGSVLISLPQPILMSNLAVMTSQYASADHLGLGMGTFMTINGLISNLIYLATLMLIRDQESFQMWFGPLLGFAIVLASLCCLLTAIYTYYNIELDSLWAYPLIVAKKEERQHYQHQFSMTYNLLAFVSLMISCALLEGCGSAMGATFEQLVTITGLEGMNLLIVILLCTVPTIPIPALIGWLADVTKATRIISFFVVLIQILAQIMLFYGPYRDTTIAFLIWITLFYAAQAGITISILQSLIVYSGWSESQVNGWLFWMSNTATAIMSLSLFGVDQTVITILGPLFVVAGILAMLAYVVGIVATQTTIKPLELAMIR